MPQFILPTKEEARARFWELRAEIAEIKAKAAPLRAKRDEEINRLMAELKARDADLSAPFKAVMKPVGLLKQELAQMAGLAGGNVGEPPEELAALFSGEPAESPQE